MVSAGHGAALPDQVSEPLLIAALEKPGGFGFAMAELSSDWLPREHKRSESRGTPEQGVAPLSVRPLSTLGAGMGTQGL